MGTRSARTVAVLALVVALLLTAVPTASSAVPSARRAPAWTDGLFVTRDASARGLPGSRVLDLTVTLEPAHAATLIALDRALADPSSPEFDRFLTESEFASRFEPPAANVSALSDYFTARGAGPIDVGPDRLSLQFPIRASAAMAAFASPLVELPGPSGGASVALAQVPSLPAPLSSMIAGVSGLTDRAALAGPASEAPLRSADAGRPQFLSGSGLAAGADWFVGSDYTSLYDETPEFPGNPRSIVNASYAGTEAVATILESGYNASANVDLPPWDPSTVAGYLNQTAAPGWPTATFVGVPVTVDQVTPPRPGPPGPEQDDTGSVVENALDLEMAASLAPGVEVANFYFAASLQASPRAAANDSAIADDSATALGQALAYNYSPRHLAAVSASFGGIGINDTLWNEELLHAAAIGVVVVASSGDAGNGPVWITREFVGNGLSWPACVAFDGSGVVAVGGATISSDGVATGSFDGVQTPALAYDAQAGGINGSVAWYDTLPGLGRYSGSQGGGAANYSEPSWQFDSAAQPGIASAEHIEGDTALHRAGPDVAFSANDTLAAVAANATGALTVEPLAGTSIAAPLFAGMIAEWSAVAGHPFGFLDPVLYRMGSYFAAHPGADDPFLDVRSGGNYLFTAGPGWDAVTGWGGIDAALFLSAYANASIRGYVYTGPTPGLPPAGSTGIPVTVLGAVLVLAVGALLVLAAVLWARTDRRRIGLATWSPADMTQGTPMFDCPYCGRPRPAAAVPCPGCGRI
jgi:kumamolisin